MKDETIPGVPVVWKTEKSEADRLLGKRARPVLDEVIALMQQFARENHWPLQQIDVCYYQDYEIREWQEIHVRPVFRLSFDDAERALENFLDQVDVYQNKLSNYKRQKFIKAVGFGFETV